MLDGSEGQPKSPLLRYWSDSRSAYEDGLVRIEWTDASGAPRSTMGRYWLDDNCVTWEYDEPPTAKLYNLAAECGASAGDIPVSGAEFMGVETRKQMEHAVEDRCETCGTVVASHHDLSLHGLCTRCFVRGMAA